MPKIETRTRILVTSLLLFNKNGEPNTTTNEIADESNVSPGNLHYHFRRKADLVSALLAEFQADARYVLVPPEDSDGSLVEFREFLHRLLEILTAYRFLFRDTETLVSTYPNVSKAIAGFSRALTATTELHVDALRRSGIVTITDDDVAVLCRNLVVIALFSERFDAVSGAGPAAGNTVARVAQSTVGVLLPYTTPAGRPLLLDVAQQYG